MSDPNQEGVRGKLHLVTLYDRKIKLQVEYHSPQKKQLEDPIADIIIRRYKLNESKSAKMIKRQTGERKKQPYRLQFTSKDPPLFYRKKVLEVNQIVRQYQQFHQKLFEKKASRNRIKVVSNSKEIKQLRAKQKEKINFQAKDNIMSSHIRKKCQIPVRKITLFSPQKEKKNNYKPKQNTIKLYQNTYNRDGSIKATPVRKKRKLQVTSSRSKNKYDSLLVSQEKSLEIKKIKMEEETPRRKIKTVTSAFQVFK